MSDRIQKYLWPLLFGVFIITLWETGVFHSILKLRPFQLPVPSEIVTTLSNNLPKVLHDTRITLTGAMIGLIIGSFLGYLIAVYATWFPKWGIGGIVLVTALNAVPIVALSPIMNLWFTTGMMQKIGVVSVVCMAAMAINAYSGLNDIKPYALDLMKTVATPKWKVFWKLRIPNSLPSVFTALRINVASSIIAAIISEYFAASTAGLGFGIKDFLRKAEMAMGWSYILVASLAGVTLYLLIILVERDVIKWHASQR